MARPIKKTLRLPLSSKKKTSVPNLDGEGLLPPPPEQLVELVVELLRLGDTLAEPGLTVLMPK